MDFIKFDGTDPYFNMAIDEYFLETINRKKIFRLWRNKPSVILGCNQAVEIELDMEYCKKNDICIVRRCTGGGTVFHDLGNINYSFWGSADDLKFVEKTKELLIYALSMFGINAISTARNDMFFENKKFSGTAVRMNEKNQLFHGTILYDVDLNQIYNISNKTTGKIQRKAVKSQKSEVINLKPFIGIEIDDFIQKLNNIIAAENGKEIRLTSNQFIEIEKLANEKYRTQKWINKM